MAKVETQLVKTLFKRLTLAGWLAVLAGLLVAGYSYWRLADLIGGPRLRVTIEQPTTFGPSLVQGQAVRIATLYLNGEKIFTDRAGFFSQTLLPLPGYNILTLEAQDKFGRTITNQQNFVYGQ